MASPGSSGRRGRRVGPSGTRRQRIQQRKAASKGSTGTRRSAAPRARVPSTNVRATPPASVSTRAAPRPYSTVTVNADPRLTGPGTGRAALPGPGPMKDVTPRKVATTGGKSAAPKNRPALPSPSASSVAGRLLGRAAGAVGAALVPTRLADATMKGGTASLSKPTGGKSEQTPARPQPARPITPTPKPAASAPAAPSVSNSDVLNRLSARGVTQSTMAKAGAGGSSEAMKKLRQLESSTRGIKRGGLKPRTKRF